jgi:hypothetical protein
MRPQGPLPTRRRMTKVRHRRGRGRALLISSTVTRPDGAPTHLALPPLPTFLNLDLALIARTGNRLRPAVSASAGARADAPAASSPRRRSAARAVSPAHAIGAGTGHMPRSRVPQHKPSRQRQIRRRHGPAISPDRAARVHHLRRHRPSGSVAQNRRGARPLDRVPVGAAVARAGRSSAGACHIAVAAAVRTQFAGVLVSGSSGIGDSD